MSGTPTGITGQGLRRPIPEPHTRAGRGHGGATGRGEEHHARRPDADRRRHRCPGAALWISPDRIRKTHFIEQTHR